MTIFSRTPSTPLPCERHKCLVPWIIAALKNFVNFANAVHTKCGALYNCWDLIIDAVRVRCTPGEKSTCLWNQVSKCCKERQTFIST